MKYCFLLLFVLTAVYGYAQSNNIVGKWKPISFSMGGKIEGDLTKDEPDIKVSLDSLVKNDKDPETSKQMMKMMFQLVFDKTKTMLEEYKVNGDYIETNMATGKTILGNYIFDAKKMELTKWYINNPKKVIYHLIWDKNNLIQKSDLTPIGNKPAQLIVFYNKL
jgi:hypothetical protein